MGETMFKGLLVFVMFWRGKCRCRGSSGCPASRRL